MSGELAAAVARVWPDDASEWELLGGGITNHNVKVTRADGVFVLRVAGRETEVLGIDRAAEFEATRTAASVGVGPEVVAFVEPEGWLVTRFIEGTIPTPEALREPARLARVARTLRAFHAAPAIPGRFDALAVVESYRDAAVARGAALPDRVPRGPCDGLADREPPCHPRRPTRATTTSSPRT